MINVVIQNFRNIRNLELTDNGKLTMLVGYNESGKSSFVNAITYAFTGEAYGHKGKDLATLITRGEPRMSVRVLVNDLLVNRTSYGTGDSINAVAERLNVHKDILPILFDSQMAGDGGGKAMRTFLSGVAADMFDPSVHFAQYPEIKDCADLAKRAGKLQVKGIISYCEDQRAMQKRPDKPIMPTAPRPGEFDVAQLKNQFAAADAELVAAKEAQSEARRISQDLAQVSNFLRALAEYEVKVANTKTDDPLGAARAPLNRLASANRATLDAFVDLLKAAGYANEAFELDAVKIKVINAIDGAKQTLERCPPPASAPVRPVEPPAFADYRNSLEAMAAGKPLTEALAIVLGQASAAVEATDKRHDAALRAKTELQQAYDSQQRLLGSWSAYDATSADYAAKAQKAEVEWARWDRAAKEIQTAHTVFLTEQSQRFSKLVSDMGSAVLGGRRLTVDVTNGITLDGLPIREVSASTRWRMEVVVMTAVASTFNSPLLLIDAADILDHMNRKYLTNFLTEHIVPRFKHVVVTMTAKGDLKDETPFPAGSDMTRWLMHDGTATRL